MRTYFDCIPCLIRQTVDSVRLATEDEQIREQVIRETLCLIGGMDFHQSPPAMAQKIHRVIRRLTGAQDPYRELKRRFNRMALDMYPELRQRVAASADPFETAVRLAIAGNIIDLGVKTGLAESQIEKAITQSFTAPFHSDAVRELRNAIASAQDILYLGDNAGEIVFDRLLVEYMPREKVTFVVRGQPVINDATLEDARMVGLTDIVSIIDNGSDAPGTILENCSQEFRNRFEEADLVIAKGQGNYETLSDIDKDIFFILKPKCLAVARRLDCEIGSLILLSNKAELCSNKETGEGS
ncbi:MAG TPA: ARMT1-like domain-containing protein [Sedimentisphaerales bacterium]|nr:ARMT1-like domain-containing protein [Sedimentisphaerales bacterium]